MVSRFLVGQRGCRQGSREVETELAGKGVNVITYTRILTRTLAGLSGSPFLTVALYYQGWLCLSRTILKFLLFSHSSS